MMQLEEIQLIAAYVLRDDSSREMSADKKQQQEERGGTKFGQDSVHLESPFREGETVYYKGKERAIILKVHLDDEMKPFYTIKLENGNREKQTEHSYLQLLPESLLGSKTLEASPHSSDEKDPSSGFQRGALVSLKGLSGRSDLNNCRGRVVSHNPATNVCEIELLRNLGRKVIDVSDDFKDRPSETFYISAQHIFPHLKVNLCHIKSQPSLNGYQGVLIDWEASKERYVVYLPHSPHGESKILNLKPSNVLLPKGCMIQLVRLKDNPSFNGKFGTIQLMDYHTDRYVVKLSEEVELRMQLENVVATGCRINSKEESDDTTASTQPDDEDLVVVDYPSSSNGTDGGSESSVSFTQMSNSNLQRTAPSTPLNTVPLAQAMPVPGSVVFPSSHTTESTLAESIQNTLSLGGKDNLPSNNDRSSSWEEESTISSSTMASSVVGENTKKKKEKNPGILKLAGRSIKKYIRDGVEETRKALSIGMGKVHVDAPTTTVFRMGNTVEGMVRLELTELIPGSLLYVRIEAFQESYAVDTGGMLDSPSTPGSSSSHPPSSTPQERQREKIYHQKYIVAGEQVYEDGASFPFRVLIPPQVRHVMSEEMRRSSSGGFSSFSTETVRSTFSSPIEWYIQATLKIPGRRSMDSMPVRIHVEAPRN